MKKKELRDRYQTDMQFKQRFHKWLSEGRITEAKQMRDLSAILANTEATKALETENFEAAAKVLIRDDPSLESDLFYSVKNATEALRDAPAKEIQDLKDGNAQKIIMLRHLNRAIEDLARLAGMKL